MGLLVRFKSLLNQLLALRAQKGPYRFLVRRWDGVSDIDLALRVLQTEFFASELEPAALPVASAESMLLLAPHQDDEAIGAGGTLIRAAKAGVKLDVLYVTDGGCKNPPYAASAEAGIRLRRQEARTACGRLGAGMHELGISNLEPEPRHSHLLQLAELIHRLRPKVLLVPWVLDLPAKHRMVNHLLWLAHRLRPLPPVEVWGYQVHNTLLPNGYVDITEVAEEKRELIACFRSQIQGGFPYQHTTLGLNAWNSRYLKSGAEPRYAEVFFTLPLDAYLKLVGDFYFLDFHKTYRSHGPVARAMSVLHHEVL